VSENGKVLPLIIIASKSFHILATSRRSYH